MAREEKCDTEGPVALTDVRNSIKRVKSDVLCAGAFKSESSESWRDARISKF